MFKNHWEFLQVDGAFMWNLMDLRCKLQTMNFMICLLQKHACIIVIYEDCLDKTCATNTFFFPGDIATGVTAYNINLSK